MTTVSVSGKKVLVDGMQFGSTYSSHDNAIRQGEIIHEKHYPQAKFEVVPEIIFPETSKKTKKRLAKITSV